MIGKIKWFNAAKGYGFIEIDNGDRMVFIHHTAIEMDGFKTLEAGQIVEFDLYESPKGLEAKNVRLGEI